MLGGVGARDAAVVGIGAVPVGRYRSILEHELLIRALLPAVRDAGIDKRAIGSLAFGNPRPYADQRYFGTFIAGYLSLPLTDILTEVLGNGMTGGLAFDIAVDRVRSGRSEISIALGVSRESHVPTDQRMELSMRAVGDIDFDVPFGVTPIAWYAMNATRYLYENGATREDLAAVAVKNRRHALGNPLAQYRTPISMEDVLSARPVVRPLHLLDVSPRSDGAVAVVIAEAGLAEKLRTDPVYVVGRGFHHEGVHQVAEVPRSLVRFDAAEMAAVRAYENAGVSPQDLDFCEVYAPCTNVEVILSEALGVCEPGAGARAAAAGETTVGGRIPISPSGGLLSRGHPPMVTPLYNIVEAVQQLRGHADGRQVEGARLGLTTAELGDYNAAIVHVLSSQRGSRPDGSAAIPAKGHRLHAPVLGWAARGTTADHAVPLLRPRHVPATVCLLAVLDRRRGMGQAAGYRAAAQLH